MGAIEGGCAYGLSCFAANTTLSRMRCVNSRNKPQLGGNLTSVVTLMRKTGMSWSVYHLYTTEDMGRGS